MKFGVNVDHDGVPGLKIEANNREEKRQLSVLRDKLHDAQLLAIRRGMADRYNACGSSGDSDGTQSLHIGLLLGGNPHHIIWSGEEREQAEVVIRVKGSQGEVESRVKDLIRGLLGENAMLAPNLMWEENI